MLFLYLIIAFPVFLLQILLPLATLLHLDLVTIYMIFVSLRERFICSVSLALILGISLDCYGTAPLGLQAGILLLAVIGVEFLRHHLNFLYVLPQILGLAIITSIQTLVMILLLHLLMPVPVVYPALVKQGVLQIAVTSLSAPVILAIFGQVEKLWRRLLLIKG